MNAVGDLRVLVNEFEVRTGPSRSKAQDVWGRSIIVALFRGQRRVLTIKAARQAGAVDAESLLWRVDLHPRVHSQEVAHSSHVVAMSVRQDDKVQLGQVNLISFCISLENV